MNAAQLINQDSGDFEYYTPIEIVDAAREVMGSIDLDPASSWDANAIVRADDYFDTAVDGLSTTWKGRVWMNHPFSKKGNPLWVNKLLEEYESGRVSQACCITFAATSEKWAQPLMHRPQCFLSPRTNYYLPDGTKKKGVSKGSMVTYLGGNVGKFREVFSQFGVVK